MSKVFLGLELPNDGSKSFQEGALEEVFAGWDVKPGRFDQLPMGGPNFLEILRSVFSDRLCIFDFSALKREEDGGINLNVLLEFGIAYGLGVRCYGLINKESYMKILMSNTRVSDLIGCSIIYYTSPENFKERLLSIKAGYENPTDLSHRYFRSTERLKNEDDDKGSQPLPATA